MASAIDDIVSERARQNREGHTANSDDRHGVRDWIAILVRQIGRADLREFRVGVFRAQMVRVGALAVAAIEWADRWRERRGT